MNPKDVAKLTKFLAEFVARSGEEDHLETCKRLIRAERLLKRIAPEVLRAEKEKVKALNPE
jgi:hypothetical protein